MNSDDNAEVNSALEGAEDRDTIVRAMVTASYLVAIADGAISQAEADALAGGIAAIVEGEVDLQGLFDVAQGRFEAEGLDACLADIGNDVADPECRRAILLVASSVAWKDGGVGTKQGLALQALARSFELPISELHQIMARAKQELG